MIQSEDVPTTFGEMLHRLRLNAGFTLGDFCRRINLEPSVYSRMERGVRPAPEDLAVLEPIRRALGLMPTSPTWGVLLGLAAESHTQIQPRKMTDAEVIAKLPAFMPNLNEQAMDDLWNAVRQEHEYNPSERTQL